VPSSAVAGLILILLSPGRAMWSGRYSWASVGSEDLRRGILGVGMLGGKDHQSSQQSECARDGGDAKQCADEDRR
jgi:hypothetical protein